MPVVSIYITGIESKEDLSSALDIISGVGKSRPDETVAYISRDTGMPASDNVGAEHNTESTCSTQKKVRRGRPKKEDYTGSLPSQEEFPFDEATAATSPQAAEPLIEGGPVEASEEVTLDDAMVAGRKLLMDKGADALRNLLTTYKVRKVGDLPADKWRKFIANCEALKGA